MKKRLISTVAATCISTFFVACTNQPTTQELEMLSQEKISIVELGSYKTKIFDESAAEIAAYNPQNKSLYVVNGSKNSIDIIDISSPVRPIKTGELKADSFGTGIQSIDTANGIVAVAVERKDKNNYNKQNNGLVAFFDAKTNKHIKNVEVGSLPDMVKFTKNGNKLLVANEGEPCLHYMCDPEGSISIIDIENGIENSKHSLLTFKEYTAKELRAKDVRIKANTKPANDLEPEYISISEDGKTAWVALQENNALAIIDIENNTIKDIVGLGYKDHLKVNNGFDGSDKDKTINIKNWPVYGMYQPDGITSCKINGKDYVLTANEGDGREYSEDDKEINYNNNANDETKVSKVKLDLKSFPNAKLLQDNKKGIGRLNIAKDMGDIDNDGDYDKIYSFGARSFSIFDANGKFVADSGDQFEKITAKRFPKNFNASNTKNKIDNRSDNKGPEPENVVCYKKDKATYALIGLERIGGIMIYNISNPKKPKFVEYVSNRDFSQNPKTAIPMGKGGDLGPEGLLLIPAKISPNKKDLFVSINEVSGTTTIYEIK